MGNLTSTNSNRRTSITSIGSHGDNGHIGTLYYHDGVVGRRRSQDPTGYSAYGGPIGGYVEKSRNIERLNASADIEQTRV